MLRPGVVGLDGRLDVNWRFTRGTLVLLSGLFTVAGAHTHGGQMARRAALAWIGEAWRRGPLLMLERITTNLHD